MLATKTITFTMCDFCMSPDDPTFNKCQNCGLDIGCKCLSKAIKYEINLHASEEVYYCADCNAALLIKSREDGLFQLLRRMELLKLTHKIAYANYETEVIFLAKQIEEILEAKKLGKQ